MGCGFEQQRISEGLSRWSVANNSPGFCRFEFWVVLELSKGIIQLGWISMGCVQHASFPGQLRSKFPKTGFCNQVDPGSTYRGALFSFLWCLCLRIPIHSPGAVRV
ncbi:hypothetical protein DPMN_071413 [Dreissena polymorpha]|uniref:Uncharacterized protein n=1 Tax=Dreissena polymorpha TaxID=45954 RepID=A0A9D4BVR4_DREPO|nr:hypothetical protein DPMN_071413 [Dreissena polymorpha]